MSTRERAADTSAKAEVLRLAVLAWPITLAQVGLMMLQLVDTAIVGQTSVDNLAGAALGRSLGFLFVSFGMGIPISLEAFATQAVGAKEPEVAWSAFRGVLRTSFVAWVPLTALSLLAGASLPAFGVEPVVARRALSFMIGSAPGTFGFLLFLGAKTLLQSHGRTRPALVGTLVANVVNVPLCMVLVRGNETLGVPALGAFGAGVGGSIATLILAGLMLHACFQLAPARPVAPMAIRRVIRLGLPIGLQLLAEVGVFSVVAVVAGRISPTVVSAHQVAIALASTTFMAALGISAATAVRVGAAVGAGETPRRVGFLGVGLGVCVQAFGALAFLLIPRALGSLFTHDPAVLDLAEHLLRIAAMFQLFDATQGVLAGALRGAGDVRFPFLVMLTGYWIVGFPVALLLCFVFGWGAPGLWWGLSAGLAFVAVALLLRFGRVTGRPIARV